VVEPPGTTVWLDGEALSVKFGAAVTTSVAATVCVRLPLTPVTVKGYDPAGVVVLVVTERAEVEVAGLGLKVPLAPEGSPLTLNVTWPVKPLVGVIVRL